METYRLSEEDTHAVLVERAAAKHERQESLRLCILDNNAQEIVVQRWMRHSSDSSDQWEIISELIPLGV